MDSQAMREAAAAESEVRSGNWRGPLHGIPLGLKDLYYTRGVRTTMGSKIMADFVPDYDATVVERLREAGGIIIGKLQMHEFAIGVTSENVHYGPARNPWDTERITGGSSGGSGSAVAAGQCMGALGSDTGGSVRIPAALCGIVGLKPTFGLVSKYGVFPASWSHDTVGPMTRTVKDAAIMLNAMAGHDPSDPSSSHRPKEDYTADLGRDIAGARIGIPDDYFFDVLDPTVHESVREAAGVLEGLGASVREVSVPMLAESAAISAGMLGAEIAETHMRDLRDRPGDFDPSVRPRLEAGALGTAVRYVRAQRARTVFVRHVSEALKQVDAFLTPTVPVTAPRLGEDPVTVGGRRESRLTVLARLTRPFSLCGIPAVTVPCGLSQAGLPIGLQLAGRPFEDGALLNLAHAYEQATGQWKRRPPI
jgi:aspartyl-tRNA(Asn)/glutamyl-tRNA(Gln) amidotransferase subunit A